MAAVQEILQQINKSLKSAGGSYQGYSCKTVSWDDVQRGTVGGSLSCWGANITDTRLWAKDGRSLFTVRSDNWNERLGKVTADEIAIVANDKGGATDTLQPYTLRTFLNNPTRFGSYAGLQDKNLDLFDEVLDKEISIRFQATFLPVKDVPNASLEFAPEAYNYNTRSDANPRNIVLVCTTQGLAVHQDGAGAKKLYHHSSLPDGTICRHWLEAERSRHQVGGVQKETKEERDDALQRGKATASAIGVKGTGTRFNALMTIQIPLKQKPTTTSAGTQHKSCTTLPSTSSKLQEYIKTWFNSLPTVQLPIKPKPSTTIAGTAQTPPSALVSLIIAKLQASIKAQEKRYIGVHFPFKSWATSSAITYPIVT
jgi:hypothetical protein